MYDLGIKIPEFKDLGERVDFIVEHKNLITHVKKNRTLKKSDPISSYNGILTSRIIEAEKSLSSNQYKRMKELNINLSKEQIFVSPVINATNWLDSHEDCHLKSIWKKGLNEAKLIYLNNNHKSDFKDIISDNVYPRTIIVSLKDLIGINDERKVECLIFDSVIDKKNGYGYDTPLYDGYSNNKIKNHSVEMRYMDILLGINDKRYPEHKEIYDAYIDEAYNVSLKDRQEFQTIWFVKQAKPTGGAAVPHGSCDITPNIGTIEPSNDTQVNIQDTSKLKPSFDKEKFKNLLII